MLMKLVVDLLKKGKWAAAQPIAKWGAAGS